MFPSSEYDNNDARAKLVRAVRDDRPVLVVGAGCSVDLGYPSLKPLLEGMRSHFDVPLNQTDADPLKHAQNIRSWLERDGHIDDYHNYLERTFGPKSGQAGHLRLHSALVRLPFCGLATTNYDPAIESALSDAFRQAPVTLDFCRERHHSVFSYLRRLGTDSGQRRADHPDRKGLHGPLRS
jgi:hypothetical protein